MRYILTILLVLSCILGCAKKDHYTGNEIETCHCDKCMDIKIGQMIMAGFKGTEPSEEIKKAIRLQHIGGVILFDKNVSNAMGERNIRSPKQVQELTTQLRSYTSRKLLIAIDQEGGLINRLKPQYGFPSTVSAAYQGRVGSLDSAAYWAAATAQTLTQCGINVNFAPCVDLSVNPLNPIISKLERAFSANPDSVFTLANEWVKEHHKQNIVTSLKHFPGHGSSLADSHQGLVDITSTWSAQELIPYQKFVANNYNGIVMVGHLFNRNIDPEYPSSLSEKTLKGLLRDQIGFKGVIATDDINMGAIIDHYTFEKALVLAINAGANLIIIGNNAKVYEDGLVARCHATIKAKVASGEIAHEMIDDSYRRLQELLADFN